MPVIAVTLIEGYPDEVRRRLCERLTDAAMAVIAAPVEGVTVFINEVAPASYMRGRTAKTPGDAPRAPAEICLEFLDAVGRRSFDRADTLVSDGFEMVFPGGVRFATWAELTEWASGRYRKIEKTMSAWRKHRWAHGSGFTYPALSAVFGQMELRSRAYGLWIGSRLKTGRFVCKKFGTISHAVRG